MEIGKRGGNLLSLVVALGRAIPEFGGSVALSTCVHTRITNHRYCLQNPPSSVNSP